MFKRRVLLPALVAVSLAGVIAAVLIRADHVTTPAWITPGVRLDSIGATVRVFATVDGLGNVTDLKFGKIRQANLNEIGVAGNYGARFFSTDGKQTGGVNYTDARPGGFLEKSTIIPQSGSGQLLIFREAGPASSYDSVLNAAGKELWRTNYNPTASAFGDLDGPGSTQFAFSTPKYAIEVRSASGALLWQTRPGRTIFQLVILSATSAGSGRLLVRRSGKLEIYGPHGQRVASNAHPPVGEYLNWIVPVSWSHYCANCLLTGQGGKFLLLSSDGQRVMQSLGPTRALLRPIAQSVKLKKTLPPYLAVGGMLAYKGRQPVGFRALGGALYIFSSNGDLVYSEAFASPIEALDVIPTEEGNDCLLIGAKNKVLKLVVKK